MSDDSGFLDHDPLDELLDRVDNLVEGWRPEPGTKIGGTVTDIDEGTSEYGTYPLLFIETSEGDVAVHCFHEVLRKAVERKINAGVLTIGADIAIKYFGQSEKFKAGQDAPHMYRVAVQPVKR